MNFHQLTGLAGVAAHENATAKKWGARFEMPMAFVALWIPLQWYLEIKGLLDVSSSVMVDWIIWTFFFVETLTLTLLATHKTRFLMGNWMNLLIIFLGFPLLWADTPLVGIVRNLRLLLIMGLLLRVSRTVKAALAVNHLSTTLWFALLLILTSGVIIASIEPGIDNPLDGIWWAWVTVSTVGYGDLVPKTHEGRLFGAVLILLGIGLFSLLTANISAFLVGKNKKQEERALRRELDVIKKKLDSIEHEIRLQNQLDRQQWDELKKRPKNDKPLK